MKYIRRKFVVEYKANRRSAKTRPDSIWGGLDLKALVREDESDPPKTMTAPSAGATTDRVPAHAVQCDAIVQPEVDSSPDHSPATPSPQSVDDGRTPPEAEVASVNELPVAQDIAAPDVKLVRERHAKSQSVRTSMLSEQHRDHRNLGSAGQPDSDDELIILEAENRRLKSLMVKKLRAENGKLRSMLKRFAVT